jgi:UDP-glucose 4-epimerase
MIKCNNGEIMEKVIVTGGAGFIGSNLVDELLNLSYEVIVIDNESSEAHDQFYWNPRAKNYKYDICDYEKTRSLYKDVSYVFHLAAESRIQSTILNPIEAVRINSLGTATVLQCSREAGVKRLVYSSTSSAYGMNTCPNDENQEDDCLNPYSVSKVSGETMCSMYTSLFGLETIILRYFNVYGNRQPFKGQYAPVIGLFLNQNNNKEKMTVVGDGLQRRDFINVEDVVQANILSATSNLKDTEFGQIYNIGSGINHSVLDIVDMINPGNYRFIPERIGESRETLANINKAKEVLGWSPKINLSEWIAKLL